MTATEFLAIFRPRIGDAGKVAYDDDELLGYVNDAIEQLSLERIAAKDTTMVTEEKITPGTSAVPDGFVNFAGQFPVYFAGGKIVSLDDSVTERTIRYFAVKPRLTKLSDAIPFGDDALHILLNYAITAAAARTGASTETESAIGTRGTEYMQKAGTGIGRVRNA